MFIDIVYLMNDIMKINHKHESVVLLKKKIELFQKLEYLARKGDVILDKHSIRYKKINDIEYYIIFYHISTNEIYLWDCCNKFHLFSNLNQTEKNQIMFYGIKTILNNQ